MIRYEKILIATHNDHQCTLLDVQLMGEFLPGSPVLIYPERHCSGCGLPLTQLWLNEIEEVEPSDPEQLALEIEEVTR